MVGVTGSPGVGKSTLVWHLARRAAGAGQRVGVLAVDPTSPLTGGALLGDRIRSEGKPAEEIFFRSVASRGQLGGTARAVRPMLHLLDAAGRDPILLETVGAGQADVAVRHLAHTVVVVTAPGMGDDVQALKAGILEIADILVVNKGDRKNSRQTAAQLEGMLALGREAGSRQAWAVPVLRTTATRGTGLRNLAQQIAAHRRHLAESGQWARRQLEQSEVELEHAVLARLRARLARGDRGLWGDLARRVAERQLDPLTAAEELLSRRERER